MSAFTPKATTLYLVAQAKEMQTEKYSSHTNTMELPVHTCICNINLQAQTKVWATHRSGKKRRVA